MGEGKGGGDSKSLAPHLNPSPPRGEEDFRGSFSDQSTLMDILSDADSKREEKGE